MNVNATIFDLMSQQKVRFIKAGRFQFPSSLSPLRLICTVRIDIHWHSFAFMQKIFELLFLIYLFGLREWPYQFHWKFCIRSKGWKLLAFWSTSSCARRDQAEKKFVQTALQERRLLRTEKKEKLLRSRCRSWYMDSLPESQRDFSRHNQWIGKSIGTIHDRHTSKQHGQHVLPRLELSSMRSEWVNER